MLNGYCLMVRDYKAEIVEFATLSVITMPDSSRLYLVHTKFGDDYMNEKDLSPTKERFEKECNDLNKALMKLKEGDKNGGNEKQLYKPRHDW